MSLERLRQRRGWWLFLMPLVFALALPGGTLAADTKVRLSVRPIGQSGPYFELTMSPGESKTLEVDLANEGSAAMAVATYAADVYTITNGGYGGRLRGEMQTGATIWLGYASEVVELGAGMSSRRAFTVAVPTDTVPGEYISSVVLENDQPVLSSEGMSLGQIVRTAVAVVVTVPGPRFPSLAIGEASHTVVTGRSEVDVELDNGGNVRLRPIANFELFDASGGLVSQSSTALDTIYAHTPTRLAVPLAALLQPGTYHVTLRLADTAQALSVERTDLTFVVAAPVAPGDPGTGPVLTAVNQAPETSIPWPLALVLLGVALLGVALFGLLKYVGRRRSRTGS
ncbi:MAG: hypothetical protein QOJ81_1996 [Chloroflexota bacterium]|nr:hypothetical protein [Chloroflexota bacterium]